MMSVLSDISLGPGRVRQRPPGPRSRRRGAPRTTPRQQTSSPTSFSTPSCCAGPARTWPRRPRPSIGGRRLQLPLLQPVLQEERQVDELVAVAAIYAEMPADSAAAVGHAGEGQSRDPRRPRTGRGPSPGRPERRPRRRPAPRRARTPPASCRRELGDPSAVRLYGIGHPGRGGRRPGCGRRPLRPAAVPGSARRRRAAPLRHEHRERDLRRSAGHRHDRVAAGQPRDREGPDDRARRRSSSPRSHSRSRSASVSTCWPFAVRQSWSSASSDSWAVGAIPRRRSSTSIAPSAYRSSFVLMGPLMVVGSYFAVTGVWSVVARVLSVPVGLLVAAILHGNEWRDISEDTRAGIVTLSSRLGKEWAHYGYVALVLGAYMTLGLVGRVRAAAAGDAPRDPVTALPRPGRPVGRARRNRPGACDRDDRPPDCAAAPRLRRAARRSAILLSGSAAWLIGSPEGATQVRARLALARRPRRLPRPPSRPRSGVRERGSGTA